MAFHFLCGDQYNMLQEHEPNLPQENPGKVY